MEDAAMFDTTTTVIALAKGGTELNPLGLVGVTAAKGFALQYKDSLPPDQRERMERTATSLWTGAGVHNVVQMLVGPPLLWSFGIGTLVGIILYYK